MPVIGLEHEPIRGFADAEGARMVTAVMKPAREQEVIEARFTTDRPMLVVMGLQ